MPDRSICIGESFVVYRENIAANLKKAGWSFGWVSAIDSKGWTICIVDAHCDDGKRFMVRVDERLRKNF